MLSEDKPSFDSRIGVTVANIVKDYLKQYGINIIIVYSCETNDNKQAKRNAKFHRWFDDYVPELNFDVFDKSYSEEMENGDMIPQYLTVLFSKTHPRVTLIRSELEKVSNWIDEDKS